MAEIFDPHANGEVGGRLHLLLKGVVVAAAVVAPCVSLVQVTAGGNPCCCCCCCIPTPPLNRRTHLRHGTAR